MNWGPKAKYINFFGTRSFQNDSTFTKVVPNERIWYTSKVLIKKLQKFIIKSSRCLKSQFLPISALILPCYDLFQGCGMPENITLINIVERHHKLSFTSICIDMWSSWGIKVAKWFQNIVRLRRQLAKTVVWSFWRH